MLKTILTCNGIERSCYRALELFLAVEVIAYQLADTLCFILGEMTFFCRQMLLNLVRLVARDGFVRCYADDLTETPVGA